MGWGQENTEEEVRFMKFVEFGPVGQCYIQWPKSRNSLKYIVVRIGGGKNQYSPSMGVSLSNGIVWSTSVPHHHL